MYKLTHFSDMFCILIGHQEINVLQKKKKYNVFDLYIYIYLN